MRQKRKFAVAAYNIFNLTRRELWNSFSLITFYSACEQALLSALAAGREKEGELARLRLWNLNSTSNCRVAPRRLSSQIFANQREAETSANVNKHCKTRCKGNGVITNVTFASQHFASTFSMQIIKFQRRSCRAPLIACSEVTRFRKALTYYHALKLFQQVHVAKCFQSYLFLFHYHFAKLN